MTPSIRISLFASAFVLMFTACPAPSPMKPDGGTTDGGGGCFDDTDCPQPNGNTSLFFCNTTTSTCEAACRQASDCLVATRGATYALDYCDNNSLHCQCDDGVCVGSLCSSDGDCGTQVCRSGVCVPAPAATTVATCTIIPDYAILAPGSSLRFHVEGLDSTGKPVVLNTGITWSATGNNVTLLTPAAAGTPYDSADFTAAANMAAASAGPTATIGTVTCSAQVGVVSNTVAAGEVAVIVTDELTGRGISGAAVQASDDTGAVVGNAGMTDATGYAKVTGVTGTDTNISVFNSNYAYLTIAGYNLSGSRVLSAVLRRNQTDKYGGQKGTFNDVPATSNVHAGLSGMSIAGSITDLSLSQLLGNSVPTDVVIGSAINAKGVPLPAGVYIGFSNQPIKTAISAQGLAGTCTGTGAEDQINAGTCGTRSGWSLAGDVPLGDLPIDAFAGGTGNLDFGTILARVTPIFKLFTSSIVRDVQFTLQTTPVDGTGAPDFSDAGTDFFTTQNLEFQAPPAGDAVPLAFDFVTQVPDLPKFQGTYVDGVVLLGGASVPGRGVIPLGIGVGVNQMPADNVTDKETALPAAGLVSVRMAPTHHGTEGSQYGVLALALSLKSFSNSTAGVATSGLFAHPSGNKLAFDPLGTTPLSLGTIGFPAFPEGAKYNFSDTDSPGLTKRSFKIVPPSTATSIAGDLMSNTSLLRVVFSDNQQHDWVVVADPTKAIATGFHIPKPPATAVDRTFANGMTTGTRSGMIVQTIRLNDGTNPVTFNQLVEANSTNADRITDFTTGFSFIDYAKPTIAWTTPAAGGTAMAGGTVVVTVEHFAVGTSADSDGAVQVTFTGGTGTCTPVTGNSDVSMGKGTINVTLPTGCTGAVTATGQLVDLTGAALNPPVTTAPTAFTIQ